ncbi:Xenotropic and polytropic retrovirus receptor 1 [Malassezia vespertilionis]|uniref:Xenotropic and polytropic retrovirus receptor 1 n=1 Tax=Malassezia vespertilionis TaxID=2020962 RepID=UPI0024B27951|nr:Xenotropic and polytropic retrovirus receptor 1 [Malassezia vespertilionis]WFD07701.1 Xenotropic and polytropic retrovirus receptor 1 [Malassezia vespertilionis]
MKFARYLEENEVDEWRKAYINYRGLKKLIKRVDEHYQRRKDNLPEPDVGAQRSRTKQLFWRGTAIFPHTNDVPNYGGTDNGIPPVSLKGTGLTLAGTHDREALQDAHHHISSPIDLAPITRDEEAGGSSLPQACASGAKPFSPDYASLPSSQVPEWVIPDRGKLSDKNVDEIIGKHFDEQERNFFLALDHEVANIVQFYEAREREAIDRLSTVVVQLGDLAEHRREYKAHEHGDQHAFPWPFPRRGYRNAPGAAEEEGQPEDLGDQRRAKAMEHVQQLKIEHLYTEDNDLANAPDLHSINYKVAKRKLRAALIENHRGLEILNNYRILNRTGFIKILKKFDKTLGVTILQPYYTQRVMNTPLVFSDVIPKMLDAVVELYASYFAHGDKKRARQALYLHSAASQDTLDKRKLDGRVAFVTGVFLGVSLCAIIEGLRAAMDPRTQELLPVWPNLLQLYGAEFIPTLFALLFGFNLIGWRSARINALFIFEWDAGNALSPLQYFQFPAFFLMLLSIFFWISFSNPTASAITATSWPLIWLVIVLVLLLNPLPIMHLSGRLWFMYSMLRVLSGGIFSRVEFRDFFLGDELNSVLYSISNLYLMGCEYNRHFSVPDTCSTTKSYWVPVLGSIPPFLRLLQCFRRYRDSDYAVRIHLLNAGKYASSILNAFFFFKYRHNGMTGVENKALWITFATINALSTSSWDLTMDWNLLRPNAKYPLLRSDLAYADIWPVYYFAMITNVMIRFVWVIFLFGGPASIPLRSFIAALLEMLRRWQWNFIRLENEHLGNADSFKIIRNRTSQFC